MGFLDRLFASDPRRDLERAEALLAKGDADRALELSQRAEKNSGPADQRRAGDLVARVKERLATEGLEKAIAAASSEYFEDAAEWITVALNHIDDEGRRQELEEQRSAFLARADDVEPEPLFGSAVESVPEAEPDIDLDLDSHYEALIGMLTEEVVERYEGQPPKFRQAYIDLNEGRADEALVALEELAETHGADPVIQLERGRCRLMFGDAEGACRDLEAAWGVFGNEPLDLTREMSVPSLWSEAMLNRGEAAALIERLADLAGPDGEDPNLSLHFAQALVVAGRFEDARDFLASVAEKFFNRPMFTFLLAQVLNRLDDRASAIHCLEMAIAPSCASGQCAKPPKHLPSLRALAAFYLDEGGQTERVAELMRWVSLDLGGRLTGEDLALVAKCHEQDGEPEAAQRALAEGRRLVELAGGGSPDRSEAPDLVGHRRAPL